MRRSIPGHRPASLDLTGARPLLGAFALGRRVVAVAA